MSEIVVIYKAPQKGKGQQILREGFQPSDFPYDPPYLDGSCYFAGPNDRSIATEYNLSYGEGIIEVSIEKTIYDQFFKSCENRYDEEGGSRRVELVVPQNLFAVLNQCPRVLKQQ